jgi:hypothetical protein
VSEYENEIQSFASFNMIKSKKLNVYTIEQTKVALNNFDDKRYTGCPVK